MHIARSKWLVLLALSGGLMSLASFEACSSGGETTDAGTDGQAADTAAPDTGSGDAASDAIADAGVDAPPCTSTCGTPNCGACPTTSAVSIYNAYTQVTYKIDEHEVTNDEYAAFLAANVATSTQPAVCSFNTSFAPSAGWPSDAGADPVAQVNWCDAYAYCAWAGKRLCGTIADAGNVASAFRDNADQSEWFSACTGHKAGSGPGGWQAYPYGNAFNAATCNGAGYGANATIPVKQAAGCVGGADGGLFDMSGNVAEWENSCIEQDGGAGTCALRGGAFYDDAGTLQCAISVIAPRTQASAGGGIRCCSN